MSGGRLPLTPAMRRMLDAVRAAGAAGVESPNMCRPLAPSHAARCWLLTAVALRRRGLVELRRTAPGWRAVAVADTL